MNPKNGLAAAVVFSFGLIGQVMAGPAFTVDPNVIPGHVFTPAGVFGATSLSGTTSALLHSAPLTNTITGSGWTQFTAFKNVLTSISPQLSGLALDYGLYATFQLSSTLLSGNLGQANSTYSVTAFNFQLYADPTITGLTTGNTYASASASSGTEAVVNDVGADDILLATGSLVSGVASFDSQGLASLEAIDAFAICAGPGSANVGGTTVQTQACTSGIGNGFFDTPDAFYGLALTAFEQARVDRAGNLIAIQSAVGALDFGNASVNNVAEPGTLALACLGMLAAGLMLRIKKSA